MSSTPQGNKNFKYWMEQVSRSTVNELALAPNQVAIGAIKKPGVTTTTTPTTATTATTSTAPTALGATTPAAPAANTAQAGQMGASVLNFKNPNDPLKAAISQAVKNKQITALGEEEVDEVLTKDTSAGEVIKDFQQSKNPKFAGKSQEERKRMALGAYYSMHPELSKKDESVMENINSIMESYTLEDVLTRFPHEHKTCQEGWGMDERLYEALCDHYFKEGRIPHKVWHGPLEELRSCVEECYMADTKPVEEGIMGGTLGAIGGAMLGGPMGAVGGYAAGSKLGDDLSEEQSQFELDQDITNMEENMYESKDKSTKPSSKVKEGAHTQDAMKLNPDLAAKKQGVLGKVGSAIGRAGKAVLDKVAPGDEELLDRLEKSSGGRRPNAQNKGEANLNELSKGTLGSYAKKANDERAHEKDDGKADRRGAGVMKAVDKIAGGKNKGGLMKGHAAQARFTNANNLPNAAKDRETFNRAVDRRTKKDVSESRPFRGVGGAFNRGDDERHDLDPSDWYVVKDGKMYKVSVYPNQHDSARSQGYSPTREEAKAQAGSQGVAEGSTTGLKIKTTDTTYDIINAKGEVVKQFHLTPKGHEYATQFLKQNKGNTGLNEQGVAEGKPQKKADRYHINKDGKPATLASYADKDSAVKDRDAKYPDAKVHQVGPRGKVKGEFEEGVTEAKADPTGSWVVYTSTDTAKFKRFKTREGAKAYAEKNGGTVASSEHYHDKIQKKDVAEGEMNTSYMNKQNQDFYDKNPNFKRSDREKKFVGNQLASKVMPTNKPGQVAKKPMTPFKTLGEGKVKQLSMDLEELTDAAFLKKYKITKAQCRKDMKNTNPVQKIKEATKEVSGGRVHTAEPGGYGRSADVEELTAADKKRLAAKKKATDGARGRGRPKKDDTVSGQIGPKFSDASKAFFGIPSKGYDTKKLPGKASVKHKIKDESKDAQMESWEKELTNLLNEGLTVSTSTGQQGMPDSVSVSATDADAQNLLQIIQRAGLTGGTSSMSSTVPGDQEGYSTVEPASSDEVMSTLEPEQDNGDEAFGFLKKMLGARQGTPMSSGYTQVAPEEEEEVEEGNAFSGAVAKAKADGIQPGEKVKVGGKEYPVKEEDDGSQAGVADEASEAERDSALATAYSADNNTNKDENVAVSEEDEEEDEDTDKLDEREDREDDEHGGGPTPAQNPDKGWKPAKKCNECGLMECGCSDEESVTESTKLDEWANSRVGGEEEQFQTEMEYMTKLISGGLNNMKRDQTTLPSTRVNTQKETADVNYSIAEMIRKLSNIN